MYNKIKSDIMIRITVKQEVLRWASERSGLAASTLAKRFPKIEQWERGEAKPTLKQLEALAKVTQTPLGYFFLDSPPEDRLPIPDLRTLNKAHVRRPSPNFLESVQAMQRRQAWMREFMIEEGQLRLEFVGSAKSADAPTQVAETIRRVLRTPVGWAAEQSTWTGALHSLRTAAEEAGILVVINGIVGNNTHRKLDPDEFRGFVLADEYAPLIFINGADGKAAQMFTLAHELAHVWFARSAAFDLRDLQPADDEIEKACDKIAAEFLIPEMELQELWPRVRFDPEPFQTVAHHFKVSVLVAARRALDLTLISRSVFIEFYRAYQEDERRKAIKRPGGGDFYANQDVRIGRWFGYTVVRAAKEGRLLYRDAYELTGLYGETFDRYSKTLGFGGAP
jgi:Zn-dependent peptidase ImmA (M78 family)